MSLPADEATTLSRLGAFESAWSEAGGEHGGALLGGEAAGLAVPGGDIGDRDAPEALEGLPGQRPGRWLFADIAGGTPHGGDYDRGGRYGPAGLVEMPQVRGEARILEPPAVELAKGLRVDTPCVRRGRSLDEPGRSLGASAVRGREGAVYTAAGGHVLHDKWNYRASLVASTFAERLVAHP